MKLLALTLAVVIPGGLVLLGAWVFARLVVLHMSRQTGPMPVRLSRAVGSVKMAELGAELKRTYSPLNSGPSSRA